MAIERELDRRSDAAPVRLQGLLDGAKVPTQNDWKVVHCPVSF